MYVYILQSKTTHLYYVGSTQDVTNRLNEHNSGECLWTRHGIPWDIVHVEEFGSRSEAVRQERRIKSRGIARYLQSVTDVPSRTQ
jgi:putative endonuclease